MRQFESEFSETQGSVHAFLYLGTTRIWTVESYIGQTHIIRVLNRARTSYCSFLLHFFEIESAIQIKLSIN